MSYPTGAQAPATAQAHAARAFSDPADAGTPAESAAAHLNNALQLLRLLPDEVWDAAWPGLTSAVKRIRRAAAMLTPRALQLAPATTPRAVVGLVTSDQVEGVRVRTFSSCTSCGVPWLGGPCAKSPNGLHTYELRDELPAGYTLTDRGRLAAREVL